jgi:hypothetical protein
VKAAGVCVPVKKGGGRVPRRAEPGELYERVLCWGRGGAGRTLPNLQGGWEDTPLPALPCRPRARVDVAGVTLDRAAVAAGTGRCWPAPSPPEATPAGPCPLAGWWAGLFTP